MKKKFILTNILLAFFFITYGILIGKYQLFPHNILKKFQDNFDSLIYDIPQEDIKVLKNKIIESDIFYEYSLNTEYYIGFQNELDFKGDIDQKIKNSSTFFSNQTAFMIMDPWPINKKKKSIIENKIIPLINLAVEKNHAVFILTPDPLKNFNEKNLIDEKLQNLSHKNVQIIYHEDFSKKEFYEYLNKNNISSLIYMGFDSNACIVTRELGIIDMNLQTFDTYFIPDASAAYESIDSDKFHEKATNMIIRYWAKEIHYDELIMTLKSL